MSHRGFMGKKRGVDPCAYVPGLYTQAEVDDLINIDGYIPLASAEEFDKIRTGNSETMGGCFIWAGNYTTGLDKKYIFIDDIDFDSFVGYTRLSGISGTILGNHKEFRNLTVNNDCILSHSDVAPFPTLEGWRIRNYIQNGGIAVDGSRAGMFSQNRGITRDMIAIDCEIYGNSECGVFYSLTESGIVEKLLTMNCKVIGTGNAVGGAIGNASGDCLIRQIFCKDTHVEGQGFGTGGVIGNHANSVPPKELASTGLVKKNTGLANPRHTGGVIGGSATAGTRDLDDCWSACRIEGAGINLGGLIGFNGGGNTVRNSFSYGFIDSSASSAGGLCGLNSGTINNSYWDTDASGKASSSGGTGQTTADLQTPTSNTGIYSAWDAAVWDFGTSTEYPKLINTP